MHYTRDNILITNGGSEALTLIFTALLNPGEEAIIAEPFYTNYNTFCNQVKLFVELAEMLASRVC